MRDESELDTPEWLRRAKRMPRRLDAIDVGSLPTISSGHFADLKIDTGSVRVWRSRCTLADGEREPVHVEFLVGGTWVDIKEHPKYQGRLNRDDVFQSADVPLDCGVSIRYILRNGNRNY